MATREKREQAPHLHAVKVAGRSASDVWMCGTEGLSLHFNGTSLERETIAGDNSLFSVAADADRVIMVGGSADGLVVEDDGSGWGTTVPTGAPLLSGVSIGAGSAVVVGREGSVYRREGGSWTAQAGVTTAENLHSAWIDPTGGVWAAGGRFDQPRTEAGVLLYGGATPPPHLGGLP